MAQAIEIILVEDNKDAEMTVRALKKHNPGNKPAYTAGGTDAPDSAFADAVSRPGMYLLPNELPK